MAGIALVGCGHIHISDYVKRLRQRTDVHVEGVWDHDPRRAATQAEALKTRQLLDVEAVWSDPKIEAVVIASETVHHEALVLAAASAGKHLFVEKPLGMGAADAFRMARAIEKSGVLFQSRYAMRDKPVIRFLRGEMMEGRFGTVTRVRHCNCRAASLEGAFDAEGRWMTDPIQAGVGGFGDMGAHSVDILLWLLGEVREVTASIRSVTGRYADCDETGEAILNFESGAIGSMAAGWVDVANPVSLEVCGTKAHAVVYREELFYEAEALPGADGKEPWKALPEALPHAFETFLDALGGRVTKLMDASEVAARCAVMEALYEASRGRSWIAPRRE